jgi:homopolymeric O-antigen transport system ATP-binding protein
MTAAIEIRELGKRYYMGERPPYRALRDTLARAIYAPGRLAMRFARRKKEPASTESEFWALRDVTLDVAPGEVVGVIGRNGAGKSTLLKLLSGVTEPTRGRVSLRGRVGSLLEVGTGFHSELTGRENVFLSGAILGMTRSEIRRKFDEIVQFAEVERFIDTPVKHYSSGMYARLGFAVAAYLEPEILLVDEVLAIGDAGFQRRSMGKMGEAAQGGRTVLFVSHNMTAITQLCSRTVLLADGRVVEDGPTQTVVTSYLRAAAEHNGEQAWASVTEAPGNNRARLKAIRVVSGGITRGVVNIDDEIAIEVDYWILESERRNLCVNVHLLDANGRVVLSTASTPAANAAEEEWFGRLRPMGLFRSRCTFPPNFLNEGTYYLSVFLFAFGTGVEAEAREALAFDVFDTGVMIEPGGGREWPGVVRMRFPWTTELLRAEIAEHV